MGIYAISDLHLGIGVDKPMDVFGEHWNDHIGKIRSEWGKTVGDDDTVIIPGDISWGISLSESKPDFEFLERLPGTKILLKGNHDYWWSTINKIETFFSENNFTGFRLLKNNFFSTEEGVVICGTRGWILPEDPEFSLSDEKIYKRELGRLENSLSLARKNCNGNNRIVAALHYPPLLAGFMNTDFTGLMEKYEVAECVFGHIHKSGEYRCFEGNHRGVFYKNVSADKIAFNPFCIKA